MREDNEWRTPKHMMLAIVLAVKQAQKLIGPVTFYVDAFGEKLLKQLPLEGVTIVNCLDEFSAQFPPEMYTISKIHVYGLQTSPFIHIDFDAFILKAFPEISNPVVSMFKEATQGNEYYQNINPLVEQYNFDCIPKSWEYVKDKYGSYGGLHYSLNAGVFGGTDMEFWSDYCSETLTFLHANIDKFKSAGRSAMKVLNLTIEQYTAATLAEMKGISPTLLFPEGNFKSWNATFPHMLSYEKQNIGSIYQMEKLIKFLYGELFDVEAATKLWVTECRKY